MKYEGIDFNEEFWKGKTEAEFVKHEGHHGLTPSKLKEAFSLLGKLPADNKAMNKDNEVKINNLGTPDASKQNG